jgi:hypothetical protein
MGMLAMPPVARRDRKDLGSHGTNGSASAERRPNHGDGLGRAGRPADGRPDLAATGAAGLLDIAPAFRITAGVQTPSTLTRPHLLRATRAEAARRV